MSWPVAAVRCVAVLTASSVLFGLTFATRSDYLGHHIAGAGGTLLVLAPLLALTRPRSWWRVAVVPAAILAGVGTEATVFRLAIFDPVDLANQSLGAVAAGAAMLDAQESWWLAATTGAVAVVALAAGFWFAFA